MQSHSDLLNQQDKSRFEELESKASHLAAYHGQFSRAASIRADEEKLRLVAIQGLLVLYKTHLKNKIDDIWRKAKHESDDSYLFMSSADLENPDFFILNPESEESTFYKNKLIAIAKLLEKINLGSATKAPEARLADFIEECARSEELIKSNFNTWKSHWLVSAFTAKAPTAVGNTVKSHGEILIDDIHKELAEVKKQAPKLGK
ncbi:MAG: hypothetical protein P4M14_07520 [Gammaproteobacteria bacterium]|nr:hypothetical protein [Gammaproteobacteria bacterium]